MTKSTYIATFSFTSAATGKPTTKIYKDVDEARAKELADRYASFSGSSVVSIEKCA